ncbi:HPF/RaiA family ribosome-associated protein [Reyranella massiliensis]|uniref:HPF/RaiA family ribosome-associated protein n=1 Tax=Reyranella massiliensis TaxID=445220 RepID=UPI0002FFFA8F|nr:HPF/RaiA family ribosome-associated protein [Reyranella massiliensis]
MPSWLQITFRNIDASPAVETKIRERARELEQFFDRIVSCRVVIEAPNRRRHGDLFHIRVDLKVPGKEIVVKRDPSEHHAHEDIYVAVRDCFDAVRRQLEDHVRHRRGDVKAHAVPAHGKVASLMAERDYGFIDASDGAEVYFHRNAVADGGFEKLAVGDEVRFSLHSGEGEKGPQASNVVAIGKHHLPPA